MALEFQIKSTWTRSRELNQDLSNHSFFQFCVKTWLEVGVFDEADHQTLFYIQLWVNTYYYDEPCTSQLCTFYIFTHFKAKIIILCASVCVDAFRRYIHVCICPLRIYYWQNSRNASVSDKHARQRWGQEVSGQHWRPFYYHFLSVFKFEWILKLESFFLSKQKRIKCPAQGRSDSMLMTSSSSTVVQPITELSF